MAVLLKNIDPQTNNDILDCFSKDSWTLCIPFVVHERDITPMVEYDLICCKEEI